MQIHDLKMPIVIGRRRDIVPYPFERQAVGFRECMLAASSSSKNRSDFATMPRVLRWLECFLQITKLNIDFKSSTRGRDADTLSLFIGAVFHPRFFEASQSTKHGMAACLIRAIPNVIGDLGVQRDGSRLTSSIEKQISRLENTDLDPHAVRIWQGWKSVNKLGQASYFALREVYENLGEGFTDKLFEALNQYNQQRLRADYKFLSPMSRLLIEEVNNEVTPDQFQDPSYTSAFFQRLLIVFLEDGYANGNGASYQTLATWWRNQFIYFARRYLIANGIFAEPSEGIPSPTGGKVLPSACHVVQTPKGVFVKRKLLTEVPLHVTDEVAINILFSEIQRDLAAVKRWARNQIDHYEELIERRKRQSVTGTVVLEYFPEGYSSSTRGWLVSKMNSRRFENAAATFEHYGFLTRHDKPRIMQMYPLPLQQTARELGLPTYGALQPFCALLIANHPEITPAFLENLELYDERGKLCAFQETDRGVYLVGYKLRAGSASAQKKILLNQETQRTLDILLRLTEPVRSYLKDKGDDAWRSFLLTSGRGFAYPKPWSQSGGELGALSGPRLVREFAAAGISESERRRIVESLGLSRIRASAAVLVYLSTHSVFEMAQALGHKEYDPRLMARYLPEPIYRFFQERWIRIFQTGIIVEALKGSDHLLEASGFSNMTEVHEFLMNHSFNLGAAVPNTVTGPRKSAEIIFGVNVEILTVLAGISASVQRCEQKSNGQARYWAGIAKHLISYIESDSCHRPDIKRQLALAKNRAGEVNLDRFVYE